MSGTAQLDATATGYFTVTKVEFYLVGASQHETLIGTGRSTDYGWTTRWDTTTVANGTYTLRSVAYDGDGDRQTSAGVSVTVSN